MVQLEVMRVLLESSSTRIDYNVTVASKQQITDISVSSSSAYTLDGLNHLSLYYLVRLIVSIRQIVATVGTHYVSI